jgi:alpha-tubulin suppressor-like RCC1 family protein
LGTPLTLPATIKALPVVESIVSVAAGSSHTCVLTQGSRVFCWGSGTHGELGDGKSTDSLDPVEAVIPGNAGERVASLVSYGWNNCALKENGRIYCWGANQLGQIGDGTMGAPVPKPKEAASLLAGDVRTLALGSSFACAVAKTDATIWYWGTNDAGQFGLGTTSAQPALMPISAARGLNGGVVQLALGNSFGCALQGDGTVSCWGSNLSGQLGVGMDAGAGPFPPTRVSIACP